MLKRYYIYTQIILIPLCGLFLSACSTYYNKATGRNEIRFINNTTENKVGTSINKQLMKKYKLMESEDYNQRLKRVIGRLLHSIDRRGLKYKVGVIEDTKFNAFTIPGGYIYATSRAAVLAHEIGHSEARHAVKRLEASMGYKTLMSLAYALDPRKKEEKDDWKLIGTGTGIIYNLITLGYSRKDEFEADRLSVYYLKQAGYDPNSIIRVLEKLRDGAKNKNANWLYFLRSHPYPDERIEAVRNEIRNEISN